MNSYPRSTFDCWEEEGLELPIHSNQFTVKQVKSEVVLRGTNRYIDEMFNFFPSPFCLMETATSYKVENMKLSSWRLFVLLEAAFSQLNITILIIADAQSGFFATKAIVKLIH